MTRKQMTREAAWMYLCHALCGAAATRKGGIRVHRAMFGMANGLCAAIEDLASAERIADDTASHMSRDLRAINRHWDYFWDQNSEGHSARAFACYLMAQPEWSNQ